jgi:lipopolysaccharide biosynthesis glycosyltransferase
MNIVVATDNNFVQHCGVMLISLLENNTDSEISVFLLTEGLTNENNEALNNIVVSKGGAYYYIVVDSKSLENCPMPDLTEVSHISLATYYRLLIPNLLPKDVSKVIYLDCDIIIRKSIKEFWEINIDDYAIGAVYQMSTRNDEDTKRLNIPFKQGYFNAGVLLINLDYWRTNSISIQLMNYLQKNHETIVYHDQDALNGVLFNQCKMVSCKWNMLTIYFIKSIFTFNDIQNGILVNDYKEYKNELKINQYDPAVIHFVSKPKPWDSKCVHPFRNEYYIYLEKSKWKNFKEPKPFISFLYRIARKAKKILTFSQNQYISI